MPDHVLRSAPLLTNLTSEERAALYQACTELTADAGHRFFRANVNDRIYLLTRGNVRVSLPGTDGEIEVARLGPGATFGEMSFLGDRAGRATVTSITPVEVLTIDRDGLDALFEEHPRMAARFWRSLCVQFTRRLSATNQLVEYYADMHQVLTDRPEYRGLLGGT